MTASAFTDAAGRLQAFATKLQQHPGLYLVDARFETIAAALVGFDEAVATSVLGAFSTWLDDRRPRYGNYWFTRTLMVDTVPDRPPTACRLTDDQSSAVADALLRSLTAYVTSLAEAPRRPGDA